MHEFYEVPRVTRTTHENIENSNTSTVSFHTPDVLENTQAAQNETVKMLVPLDNIHYFLHQDLRIDYPKKVYEEWDNTLNKVHLTFD